MKLHIFNPEHDMALGSGQDQFTAPHAGRAMRHDLDYLPALWADDGDFVLVDDAAAARGHARHLKELAAAVHFIDSNELGALKFDEIEPWGWDKPLRHDLIKAGVDHLTLPTDDELQTIRTVSNRQWASFHLLPRLQGEGIVGEAEYADTFEKLAAALVRFGKAVVKAPWSSSGRGIRYVDGSPTSLNRQFSGWANNVIHHQGGVTIEPYYEKIKDFGAEFLVGKGRVEYRGLSLFRTVNGAYAGNILATEAAKAALLARFVPQEVLEKAVDGIISVAEEQLLGRYRGPFGVDMMVVANEKGYLLHPCVELNLRRTMGHVALAVARTCHDPQRFMRISYDGHYHFRILNTNENVVDKDIY